MTTTSLNWTNSTGKEISITVTADFGLDLNGYKATNSKMYVRTVAHVVGMGEVGNGPLVYRDGLPAGGVAMLGKLCLTADRAAWVEAARAAAQAVCNEYNATYKAAQAPMRSARSIELAMACGE